MLKNDKADLFYSGATPVSFCGGERLGSTPNATGKWKFIAKEQGGGWWMEILRGNVRGKKGFWLNRPYRILAEWSDITWGAGGEG